MEKQTTVTDPTVMVCIIVKLLHYLPKKYNMRFVLTTEEIEKGLTEAGVTFERKELQNTIIKMQRGGLLLKGTIPMPNNLDCVGWKFCYLG